MGQIKPVKFLVAIALFVCVGLAIYTKPHGIIQTKTQQLSPVLSGIKNWQVTSKIPLQAEIIDSLQLDDYLFQNYSRKDQHVGLYIGYYLTTGKVGAAHDPLVCLPGQGWLVKQRGRGQMTLDDTDHSSISYATMVVERSGEQELFLYWFQAYDKAVADTLSQKIVSLTNSFKGLGQDNAFVRLSCRMNGRTEEQCRQILTDFVRDFYPVFLNYIRGAE